MWFQVCLLSVVAKAMYVYEVCSYVYSYMHGLYNVGGKYIIAYVPIYLPIYYLLYLMLAPKYI